MEMDEEGEEVCETYGRRKGSELAKKSRVLYIHCRINKGNLQSWRHTLDSTNDPTCRFSVNHMETDKHVGSVCQYGKEIGRRWSSWKEMDERKTW